MTIPSIELDETFWGPIVSYTMPIQGGYRIVGRNKIGWLLTPSAAGEYLSEAAQKLGDVHGGWLRFIVSSEEADFIKYDLLELQAGNLTDPFVVRVIEDEMASCAVYGYIECPEYFGLCPPPARTPDGSMERFKRICNGIYCIKSAKNDYLSLHRPIGDMLSLAAFHAATIVDDDLFLIRELAPVAVYELRTEYPELQALIASEEALLFEVNAFIKEHRAGYKLDSCNPPAPTTPATGPSLHWPLLE